MSTSKQISAEELKTLEHWWLPQAIAEERKTRVTGTWRVGILTLEHMASLELYSDGQVCLNLVLMASIVALSSRYRLIRHEIKELHT